MTNLVNITNANLTMSSLEIAELTGKRHDSVLRDVRKMLNELKIQPVDLGQSKFGQSDLGLHKFEESSFEGTYINQQGKKQPCYNLPKEETLCLVAGYSTVLRMKIIKRWQELEKQNAHKAPNNLKEALLLAYKQQEQLEEQEKIIQEAKPKLVFASAVEGCKNAIAVGELAKILKQNGIDIGQNRLFSWLRDNEYIHKHKTTPTQKSMELGLFTIKETAITKPNGDTKVYLTPKVTGKGQSYFVNKFLNKKRAM